MDYKKVYTREYSLLTLCAWQEYQQKYLSKDFNWEIPPIIFDVNNDLTSVYIEQSHLLEREQKVFIKINNNPEYIKDVFENYQSILNESGQYKNGTKKISSLEELENFYTLSVQGWLGYALSYFIPTMQNAPQQMKDLAMSFRESSDHFLEDNDKVYKESLPIIFTDLKDLSNYIASFELRNSPDKNILEIRSNHYVFYDNNLITTETLDEIIKKIGNSIVSEEQEIDTSAKEIKGQIAMKGKVEGIVRIISKKSEIEKLQNGEILIATMTTPDYIPAMKKASAFVTDEGGITCHAAIIAREMKKPCIIGTKIATKVFKDGDMVEVDAEKGIISLIS